MNHLKTNNIRDKKVPLTIRTNARSITGTLLFVFLLAFLPDSHLKAVPGYARQTGMSCAACHNPFPVLTSFGRQFKENGYTLTAIKTYKDKGQGGSEKLRLISVAPLSVMFQTSLTTLNKPIPDTKNSNVELPQQLSLFYAGSISSHMGMFLQVTYDSQSGSIGMDNADIRYARNTTLMSRDLTWGITLNNNPTVQDLWNTLPAWGYPYASSDIAPSPAAGALIDGGLGQQVAGIGGYALFNQLVYFEATVYRTAQQGAPSPPATGSEMVVKGVAPYWRIAFQHQWPGRYLEAGFFGMAARIFPSGVSGLTDNYTDLGFDVQYEKTFNTRSLVAHASFVREMRTLEATAAGNPSVNADMHLNSLKLDGSFNFSTQLGTTLGYFIIDGSRAPGLYQAESVSGSANGSPQSDGFLAQLYYLPWYNVKLTLQYTAYNHFNGSRSNYDGFERNPADNNCLYILLWFNF